MSDSVSKDKNMLIKMTGMNYSAGSMIVLIKNYCEEMSLEVRNFLFAYQSCYFVLDIDSNYLF